MIMNENNENNKCISHNFHMFSWLMRTLSASYFDRGILNTIEFIFYLGVGSRLLEKSQKQNQTPQITTVKASVDLPNAKRGFDINSPRLQSPAVSGRNTPVGLFEDGSKLVQSATKSKEQLSQDAKDLYEKERGNEKPHIHLVVIGHVDAGKSTLLGTTLTRSFAFDACNLINLLSI